MLIGLLNERSTPEVAVLRALLERGEPVAFSDVSLLEVLQAGRTDRHVRSLEDRLARFPMLSSRSPGDFRAAAGLYRAARRRGLTIRSSLNCLIAAACIRIGAELLHRDVDFDRLASVSDLRLVVV